MDRYYQWETVSWFKGDFMEKIHLRLKICTIIKT
nr:MAG TPA: hypothetical protein [Caudoviricetes sp.]